MILLILYSETLDMSKFVYATTPLKTTINELQGVEPSQFGLLLYS